MDLEVQIVCSKCNLPNPIRKGRTICIPCQNQNQRDYVIRRGGKEYIAKKNRAYLEANKDRIHRDKHQYYVEHWVERILYYTRFRAEKKGIPFNLTLEDIHLPEFCPVLGIRLQFGGGPQQDSSPSIDRIIPKLGYVRGNVVVISHRANRLKGDATYTELERIASWLRSVSTE